MGRDDGFHAMMRAFIRNAGVYVWHTMVCVTALALVLTLFWGVSYVMSVRHRRQAERMLQQLAALPPGATDFSTIQRIPKDSGGREYCTEELCNYVFDGSGFLFPASWLPRVLKRTEWDYLGLRPWQIYVVILKRPSGLADLEVIAAVGRGRGWLENEGLFSGNMWASSEVVMRTDPKAFDLAFQREKEEVLGYGKRTEDQIESTVDGIIVNTPRPGEKGAGAVINVHLSPKAPSDIRGAAFDINLRCATDFSPCTDLCQFAPSAWQSYVRFLESNGLTTGQSPECAAAQHR